MTIYEYKRVGAGDEKTIKELAAKGWRLVPVAVLLNGGYSFVFMEREAPK